MTVVKFGSSSRANSCVFLEFLLFSQLRASESNLIFSMRLDGREERIFTKSAHFVFKDSIYPSILYGNRSLKTLPLLFLSPISTKKQMLSTVFRGIDRE